MAVDGVITYRVWYKPNPNYQGGYDGGAKTQGLHGTFITKETADAAAKACKRYFNRQKFFSDVVHPDGSVTQEPNHEDHDNVTVWVEKLVDGAPVEPASVPGKKKELAPA